MNRKTKIGILALAFLLILSLTANGILATALAREKKDSNRHLYDPDYALGGDGSDIDVSIEETTEPKFAIETQIITLYLPQAVQDRITFNTVENEQGTNITFTGKEYAQELVLFSVALTKGEPEGYLLGVLKDETKGEWKVAVNVTQINSQDWSEEQYSEISALQQCVNDIMIQIQEDPRFVLIRADG